MAEITGVPLFNSSKGQRSGLELEMHTAAYSLRVFSLLQFSLHPRLTVTLKKLLIISAVTSGKEVM